MKIAILTSGTRGDVQPYVALGKALRARGHDVLLACPDNFAAWIKRKNEMKRFVQIIKWVAYIFVGLKLLVLISLQVHRSYLRNSTKIETPNGISSLEEITLGGVNQWIFIRGTDQEKSNFNIFAWRSW